jgi:catechol 2,3-dioxygenase-like lactoylglutathione lyase family enzyme
MANTLLAPDALVDDNGAHIICPTLQHCGTQTSRAEELLRWYRNVLGQQPTLSADPPAVPFPATWTTNDEHHHRMGFFSVPGCRDQFDMTAPGVQHIAWEYEDLDDLLESVMRIKALGIEPVFCVNHRISFAAYFRDPDGFLVELFTDAFGDHAKSMELQLNSDELRANPPGVPWDPQQLYEARRAGASREELYERSLAGEFAPAGAHAHDIDGKIPKA